MINVLNLNSAHRTKNIKIIDLASMCDESVNSVTQYFLDLSSSLLRNVNSPMLTVQYRRFRSLFGLAPSTCTKVWITLERLTVSYLNMEHFLCALVFLKVYSSESVHSAFFGIDEKTFRIRAWCYVKLLANLKVVSSMCNLYLDKSNRCRYFGRTDYMIPPCLVALFQWMEPSVRFWNLHLSPLCGTVIKPTRHV